MSHTKIDGAIFAITQMQKPVTQDGESYVPDYQSWNTSKSLASLVLYALSAYAGYKIMQVAQHKVLTAVALLIAPNIAFVTIGAVVNKLDPTESHVFTKLYPRTALRAVSTGLTMGTVGFAASTLTTSFTCSNIAVAGITYLFSIGSAQILTSGFVDGDKFESGEVKV